MTDFENKQLQCFRREQDDAAAEHIEPASSDLQLTKLVVETDSVQEIQNYTLNEESNGSNQDSSSCSLLSNVKGSPSFLQKIRTKNTSFKTPGKHAPNHMLNNEKDLLDTTELSVYEGTTLDDALDNWRPWSSRSTKKQFSARTHTTPTSIEKFLVIDSIVE